MEFVLKNLEDTIKVTGIANLHFFEFPENFFTLHDHHPFCELVFIVSGRLRIKSDNFNGILEKQEMLIHRADEQHSLETVEGVTPTVIIIGFNCKSGNLDRFSSTATRLDEKDVKKLAEIIKEGRNVFAPPYDQPTYDMKKKKDIPYGAEQLLKNLLEYLLISVTRRAIETNLPEETAGLDKFSASEIISYIDDNYKEKITLDQLAFIFRTNRSTLCKVFKSSTGTSIIEYVNAKKLNSAKRRILSTNKTMTEIAEDLNFESIHYFTRFFKKQTGLSPNEFRKLYKSGE